MQMAILLKIAIAAKLKLRHPNQKWIEVGKTSLLFFY
jgi:hypothetical protein